MKAELIIYNISILYTPFHKPPVKGHDMKDIRIIEACFVAIKDERIIAIETEDIERFMGEDTIMYDASGKIGIPGLIDGHSHLVHAGSREDEFDKLRSGVPYLDILRAGGGILSTVQKTNEASFKELYEKAVRSLDVMLSHGVTTLETKSGYGLSLQQEIKQLEVAKAINRRHPIDIYSTYMGAHAVPNLYKDDKKGYIASLIKDMSIIKNLNLAKSVDVFCESHVFDIPESRYILEQAKTLGFDIRLHADEIDSLGGAGLGVELGAKSVDHLMAISNADILKLAHSNTIANVLPGTSFHLGKPYAPARLMIDKGVALGIAGDYNPGSCPCENFLLILQLAANKLNLNSAEVLTAATINPAYHLDRSDQKGSLEVGKQADIVLLDAPNLNYVFYHFGTNHVTDVFIKGNHVIKNKHIEKEFI